jgi:uncharacterized integral membrane protein (TIGR00698 family)
MKKLPGILTTFLISLLAYAIGSLPFRPFSIKLMDGRVVHPLEAMVIAIILGIIIANLLLSNKNDDKVLAKNCFGYMSATKISESIADGVNFSIKFLLPLGIVLMGVKFDLMTVFKISANALILNVACVILAYFITIWICKCLKIDSKMSALIAIGTAICGGSAIVVLAPLIKSNRTQTSIAITIVSLFGLIAIFLYPYIGHLTGLTQTGFGIWAGTAIQAVPQVVAAGFTFGVMAGQVATIVKMVRILLLAPMVILIGAKHHKQNTENTTQKTKWSTFFPKFILFFLLMVVLKSIGVIDFLDHLTPHTTFSTVALSLSSFLMTMAMAGVGLNTHLGTMLKSGMKPLLAGFIAASAMAGLSIGAVLIFFNH